jgi:hypothetical protein
MRASLLLPTLVLSTAAAKFDPEQCGTGAGNQKCVGRKCYNQLVLLSAPRALNIIAEFTDIAGADQQVRITAKAANHLSVHAKERLLLNQYQKMLAVDSTSTVKHAKEIRLAIVVVSTDTVEIAPRTAPRVVSLALDPAYCRPFGTVQSAARA